MPVRFLIGCLCEMNDDHFCTVGFDLTDGTIRRPFTANSRHLQFGHLLVGGNERRLWQPGRVAEIDLVGSTNARPTHPEDSIMRLGTRPRLVGYEGLPNFVRTSPLATRHVFDSIHELFPGVTIDWQKVFYRGSPTLPRSVGYLEVDFVRVVEEGAPGHKKIQARVTDKEGSIILLPIKDLALADVTIGQVLPATHILVGLANPFNVTSGGVSELRAYAQLLHLF